MYLLCKDTVIVLNTIHIDPPNYEAGEILEMIKKFKQPNLLKNVYLSERRS